MIALTVSVAREHAEAVLAELLELVPGGVEERDGHAGTIDYVIYGAAGELPELPVLRAAAGDALVRVSTAEVADDWGERWKAFHRPIELGGTRRVRVRPPWEPARPEARALDIVIDPGQAFGTGAHATTRLCLELLLEREPAGALADWGCGSGVLAIVAARMGFAPVVAVDADPVAVEATRENARVNGVRLDAARADLRRAPGPWAPTVTANLIGSLLLDVTNVMTRPPRVLIASGLLSDEADRIAAAFARHGLRETGRRTAAEWAALVLERR